MQLRMDTEIPDVLFFDLETQKLFQEVGGYSHTARLLLAIGVVYSTRRAGFEVYGEPEAQALIRRLEQADLVVGFNLVRFDYQVLQPYGLRPEAVPTLDMLQDIHRTLGFRVSLDSLARATLGKGKTADGLQSVQWFRDGRLDLVTDYCRADVAVTKDLFDFGLREGYLRYCDRDTGRFLSVRVNWGSQDEGKLYLRAAG